MTVSVSIDRTSLSLSPLVIDDNPASTYRIAQGGLSRPTITPRETNAPDSRYFEGTELLAVTREQTRVPVKVIVQGASWAAVESAVDALDAAVWQFMYDVTVTVDGVAKTWYCTPAIPVPSGLIEPENVSQFFDVFDLDIPCKPTPA